MSRATTLSVAAAVGVTVMVVVGFATYRLVRYLQTPPTPEEVIERLRKDRDVAGLTIAAQTADRELALQAVAALGHCGAGAAEPLLEAMSGHVHPEVRAAACAALNRALLPWQVDADVRNGLLRRMRNDPSPDVRAAAATSIGHLRIYQHTEELLREVMTDDAEVVQLRAWQAVEKITARTFPVDPKMPMHQQMKQIEEVYRMISTAEFQLRLASYYNSERFRKIYLSQGR